MFDSCPSLAPLRFSADGMSCWTSKIPCMYTKHLAKKRKTWSDGVLRLVCSNGSVQCTLHHADGHSSAIEGRSLTSFEARKIEQNQEMTLEFENHIVSIECSSPRHEESSLLAKLRLQKFVPPSRIARKSSPQEKKQSQVELHPKRDKSYKVVDDELDGIWGLRDVNSATVDKECCNSNNDRVNFVEHRDESYNLVHGSIDLWDHSPGENNYTSTRPKEGKSVTPSSIVYTSSTNSAEVAASLNTCQPQYLNEKSAMASIEHENRPIVSDHTAIDQSIWDF